LSVFNVTIAPVHQGTLSKSNFHRHGAGAARRAHNPEVTGSKPVAGIYHHHRTSASRHFEQIKPLPWWAAIVEYFKDRQLIICPNV
jgi:hypothetical protein